MHDVYDDTNDNVRLSRLFFTLFFMCLSAGRWCVTELACMRFLYYLGVLIENGILSTKTAVSNRVCWRLDIDERRAR